MSEYLSYDKFKAFLRISDQTEVVDYSVENNYVVDISVRGLQAARDIFNLAANFKTITLYGNSDDNLDHKPEYLDALNYDGFELELRGFEITTLPSWIYDVPKLMRLDLSENNIRSIDLRKFSELQEFLVSDQYLIEITNIPKSLRVLDISATGLTLSSLYFLLDLPNLEELNLSSMPFSSISDTIFSNLNNLEVLNISDNKLDFLHENIFAGLKKLKILDLSDNHITDLPLSFSVLTNLETLLCYPDTNIDRINLIASEYEINPLDIGQQYIKEIQQQLLPEYIVYLEEIKSEV